MYIHVLRKEPWSLIRGLPLLYLEFPAAHIITCGDIVYVYIDPEIYVSLCVISSSHLLQKEVKNDDTTVRKSKGKKIKKKGCRLL